MRLTVVKRLTPRPAYPPNGKQPPCRAAAILCNQTSGREHSNLPPLGPELCDPPKPNLLFLLRLAAAGIIKCLDTPYYLVPRVALRYSKFLPQCIYNRSQQTCYSPSSHEFCTLVARTGACDVSRHLVRIFCNNILPL